MIALVGSTPKYRPSSESADCQFMRKTSPSAISRQPCQMGSGRPRLSRLRATPHLDPVDGDPELLPTHDLPRKRRTVAATAGGLCLLAFRPEAWAAILGLALIGLPHLIGAPVAPEAHSEVPAALSHRFIVLATLTSLLF
jgi:hypothetical protein